jgi:hypothetical protein
MFSNNPFTGLAYTIPTEVIQIAIVLMIVSVIAGTLFDVIHKKSAKYFFENWRKSNTSATKDVGGGEVAKLAIETLVVDVATSSELGLCGTDRRIAHLLTMWGFVVHVSATIAMAIVGSESTIWPMLWHLGALSVCVGGYWFWFFIRVDVSAEGNSPFRLIRADLFVLSLVGTTTFALLWSLTQGGVTGWVFFGLYLLSAIALFGGVPWSKFSHMFFKPAAALQKKISKADGSQENMPDVGEMNDPAIQAKFPDLPMYLGKNPPNFGLGIKREKPRHY